MTISNIRGDGTFEQMRRTSDRDEIFEELNRRIEDHKRTIKILEKIKNDIASECRKYKFSDYDRKKSEEEWKKEMTKSLGECSCVVVDIFLKGPKQNEV